MTGKRPLTPSFGATPITADYIREDLEEKMVVREIVLNLGRVCSARLCVGEPVFGSHSQSIRERASLSEFLPALSKLTIHKQQNSALTKLNYFHHICDKDYTAYHTDPS